MSTSGRRAALLFTYLEKWAVDTPGKIALIEYESGRQWMYRQLLEQVNDTARVLLASGIRPGDRVAVYLPLNADFVALMFACFRVGALFCPLPDELPPVRLASLLDQLDPACLVYECPPGPEKEGVRKALQRAGSSRILRIVRGDAPATGNRNRTWDQWMAPARLLRLRLMDGISGKLARAGQSLHASSPALVCMAPIRFQPVVLCYENLLEQRAWLDLHTRMGRHDKVLASAPVAGLHTLIQSLIVPLTLGASVLLMRQVDAEASVQALHRHCISFLIQPAGAYRAMLQAKAFESYAVHTLRWALLTDRPPLPRWMARLRRFAPQVGAGWSLPEAGGFVAFDTQATEAEEMILPAGILRKKAQFLSIRTAMDATGSAGPELPDDHVGEVCLHPPGVFSGYFGDAAATREAISREGIFYTGTQGFIRRVGGENRLFLLDTSSEKLRTLRKRWLEQGIVHPVMAPAWVYGEQRPA